MTIVSPATGEVMPATTPSLYAALAGRIEDAIEAGVVSPGEIAERVRPHLTAEQREELARYALVHIARRRLHDMRRPKRHDLKTARKGMEEGSPRWREVAKLSHNPLEWRIPIASGGWRVLAECTAAEVRTVADAYMNRARQNAAIGKRYLTLAEQMAHHDATVVGDLDREVVERVMQP